MKFNLDPNFVKPYNFTSTKPCQECGDDFQTGSGMSKWCDKCKKACRMRSHNRMARSRRARLKRKAQHERSNAKKR